METLKEWSWLMPLVVGVAVVIGTYISQSIMARKKSRADKLEQMLFWVFESQKRIHGHQMNLINLRHVWRRRLENAKPEEQLELLNAAQSEFAIHQKNSQEAIAVMAKAFAISMLHFPAARDPVGNLYSMILQEMTAAEKEFVIHVNPQRDSEAELRAIVRPTADDLSKELSILANYCYRENAALNSWCKFWK